MKDALTRALPNLHPTDAERAALVARAEATAPEHKPGDTDAFVDLFVDALGGLTALFDTSGEEYMVFDLLDTMCWMSHERFDKRLPMRIEEALREGARVESEYSGGEVQDQKLQRVVTRIHRLEHQLGVWKLIHEAAQKARTRHIEQMDDGSAENYWWASVPRYWEPRRPAGIVGRTTSAKALFAQMVARLKPAEAAAKDEAARALAHNGSSEKVREAARQQLADNPRDKLDDEIPF